MPGRYKKRQLRRAKSAARGYRRRDTGRKGFRKMKKVVAKYNRG